jgi:hypothetical protein
VPPYYSGVRLLPSTSSSGYARDGHASQTGPKSSWHESEGQPRLDPCAFRKYPPTIRLPARLLCPSCFVASVASLCTALSRTSQDHSSRCRWPSFGSWVKFSMTACAMARSICQLSAGNEHGQATFPKTRIRIRSSNPTFRGARGPSSETGCRVPQ